MGWLSASRWTASRTGRRRSPVPGVRAPTDPGFYRLRRPRRAGGHRHRRFRVDRVGESAVGDPSTPSRNHALCELVPPERFALLAGRFRLGRMQGSRWLGEDRGYGFEPTIAIATTKSHACRARADPWPTPAGFAGSCPRAPIPLGRRGPALVRTPDNGRYRPMRARESQGLGL